MEFIKDTFQKFLFSKKKNILIENFLSLSFLQIMDYVLPIITLPYLVRVLGPEKYGLIAFAKAFIQYFVILTDYGFNLSATREISIYRENKNKISEIFSSVMSIKFCFMLISFIILIGLILSIPKIKSHWLIYIFTFGSVLGQSLFPIWFFQGMEKMKYITLSNIVSKIIFTVSIFIFVKKIQDYIYVPLITSLGFLVTGIIGLWIIYKNFEIKFIVPNFKQISYQLKEGWYVFISTMSITLYTNSNTFILGLFTNNAVVGYYVAAEKIITVIQRILHPFSQTIYPYISKLVVQSKQKALNFTKKILIFIGIISFAISLFILIFARPIINIILGRQFQQSIIVLQILSFLPFIISLSNILGIQIMLTFNFKKAFSRILISAGIINIILALLLTPCYKYIGISISVLVTEIFVTASMFFYLYHKKLLL